MFPFEVFGKAPKRSRRPLGKAVYLVASPAIYRHAPFDGIDRTSPCVTAPHFSLSYEGTTRER
jgi:hypothetical protein